MDMEFQNACQLAQRATNEMQSAMQVLNTKYNELQRQVHAKDMEIARLREENARLQRDMSGMSNNGRAAQATEVPPPPRQGIVQAPPSVENTYQLERVIQIHEAPVHAVTVATHETGDPVMATASWDATVKLYNLNKEEIVKTLGDANQPQKMGGLYSVAFAKTAPEILGCTSCDKSVYLWNHKTGSLVSTLVGHADEVNGINFHSSQNVMCTASDDMKVIIWDFHEGITLRTLDKHTKAVYGTTFLGQENQYFVGTCCFDQKTRIFDMRDKQIVAMLQTHTDDVIGIDYSSANQILATGSDDGLVCLWDTKTWKLRHKISTKEGPGGIPENEVKRVSFSPDGKRLAAACSSGRVLVYDLANFSDTHAPQRIADLTGHTDCVFDVSWNHDTASNRRLLVSASHDHTCRYWSEPMS